MDPEDEGYVCSLPPEAVEKARIELHEDPRERLNAVATLRKWIRQQPHIIKCPLDTSFLLMILRGSKFSQLLAREKLQLVLSLMTSLPEVYTSVDTHEPLVQAFLDTGFMLPLPKKDPQGRQMCIIRPGMIDTKKELLCVTNEMRAGVVFGSLFRKDEITQVYGMVMILDLTGFTFGHLTRMTNENFRRTQKTFQEANTGRMKAIHIYNSGSIFEAFMAILRPILKPKFQKRMRIHDTLESLYKCIPMELFPVEYLPDDYKGPNAGTAQQIIDSLRVEVSEERFRQNVLSFSSQMQIDETKKLQSVENASFRKINVD